jgi:hypothetical protein
MVDMAPDHQVTTPRGRLLARRRRGARIGIYQPHNIEKTAPGAASLRSHVTKYIQPGIELITSIPALGLDRRR